MNVVSYLDHGDDEDGDDVDDDNDDDNGDDDDDDAHLTFWHSISDLRNSKL